MKKRIEIIDAAKKQGTGSNGSTYDYIEVTYKSEYQGKPEYKGYKALKFNTPDELWDRLLEATKGDTFDVIMEKNPKGYWQWLEIFRQDAAPSEGAPVASEKAAAYQEQEARRQTLIIRQSVLKAAVDVFAAGMMEEDKSVLDKAAEFEQWVTR